MGATATTGKVPKFMAPIPSETTHTMKIMNPFNVIYPIIFPLELTRITSYFDVRKPTQKEYEDSDQDKKMLEAYKICQALNLVGDSRVCLTTGNDFSSLPLQQGDIQSLNLPHCMLMILHMLWTMTTLPLCWKFLSLYCHYE